MEITQNNLPDNGGKPQQVTLPAASNDESFRLDYYEDERGDLHIVDASHNESKAENALQLIAEMITLHWPMMLIAASCMVFSYAAFMPIVHGQFPPPESIPGYFITLSLLSISVLAHSLKRTGLMIWLCAVVIASSGYLAAGLGVMS